MPLLDTITSFITGGKGELVKNIFDGVKQFVTTDKDRLEAAQAEAELNVKISEVVNQHMEKVQELTLQETSAYLQDVANSREANVKIQESDKASYLAKNVGYFIDLFIVSVWGFLTIYLMCVMLAIVSKTAGVDYTAVTAVWGGVTAFAGTIVNFHRGSSKSSEDKGKVISGMIESNK